jgi:hypothetical protein
VLPELPEVGVVPVVPRTGLEEFQRRWCEESGGKHWPNVQRPKRGSGEAGKRKLVREALKYVLKPANHSPEVEGAILSAIDGRKTLRAFGACPWCRGKKLDHKGKPCKPCAGTGRLRAAQDEERVDPLRCPKCKAPVTGKAWWEEWTTWETDAAGVDALITKYGDDFYEGWGKRERKRE